MGGGVRGINEKYRRQKLYPASLQKYREQKLCPAFLYLTEEKV